MRICRQKNLNPGWDLGLDLLLRQLKHCDMNAVLVQKLVVQRLPTVRVERGGFADCNEVLKRLGLASHCFAPK